MWKKYSITRHVMDNKIRRVRIAYWLHKAKNTHSEYIIHINFSLQQSVGTRLIFALYVHRLGTAVAQWLRSLV
jgi:hypothetical protein